MRQPRGDPGVGRRLGAALRSGDVLALVGPLGSGKTTLVKGMAAGAGVVDLRQVNSPTFVIVNEYEAHAARRGDRPRTSTTSTCTACAAATTWTRSASTRCAAAVRSSSNGPTAWPTCCRRGLPHRDPRADRR